MADDFVGREILRGMEDGRPEGNWREVAEQPDTADQANLAGPPMSHLRNRSKSIEDLNIGPKFVKGTDPDELSIAEAKELGEQKE